MYSDDDAHSKAQMKARCREVLGPPDLRMLDAECEKETKHARELTAWRIEGTLREFARFDPVNLWFEYPIHKIDDGLLEDLQPESDSQQRGKAGASKRWSTGGKDARAKASKLALSNAFEAAMMDGAVTIYGMAEYMDLRPRTVKERLKADGGYWIDGEKVGRKEPGCRG